MRHTLFFLIAAFLLGSVCPVQAAGQLFPPSNQKTGKCPAGQVLAWSGNSINCVNPTPGVKITPTCPTGEVYYQIRNGVGKCAKPSIPSITCKDGFALQKIANQAPTCINIKSAASTTLTCGTGKAIQKIAGGVATCIDIDSGDTSTISCGDGKAIQKIVNDVATCITLGEETSPLTASCPSEQILQSIENGRPVCVSTTNSAYANNVCKTSVRHIYSGYPSCYDFRPEIGGQYTVKGGCLYPNPLTQSCTCPVGYDPARGGYHAVKTLEAGGATQYTCYRDR